MQEQPGAVRRGSETSGHVAVLLHRSRHRRAAWQATSHWPGSSSSRRWRCAGRGRTRSSKPTQLGKLGLGRSASEGHSRTCARALRAERDAVRQVGLHAGCRRTPFSNVADLSYEPRSHANCARGVGARGALACPAQVGDRRHGRVRDSRLLARFAADGGAGRAGGAPVGRDRGRRGARADSGSGRTSETSTRRRCSPLSGPGSSAAPRGRAYRSRSTKPSTFALSVDSPT